MPTKKRNHRWLPQHFSRRLVDSLPKLMRGIAGLLGLVLLPGTALAQAGRQPAETVVQLVQPNATHRFFCWQRTQPGNGPVFT